jgi:Rrf2 family protein
VSKLKFSTKGRYGLRAMVYLAMQAEGEPVALINIAESQNISMNYLEQVFAILRKAGLIKSIKGAYGGYILSERADQLKVGKILRALEGSLSVIDEKIEDFNGEEASIQECIKINVWDRMDDYLNKFLDSITLGDLVSDYRKMIGFENTMYYI